MGKGKKETEKEKTHRIFKWYKVRGDFPPDVKPIDAYILMSKYNYFITKGLNQKHLLILKNFGEKLQDERIVIAYGDFTLEEIEISIELQFNNIVNIVHIDCLFDDYIDILHNALPIKSQNGKFTVFVLDNIENISKKYVKSVLKTKNEVINYSKAIVLCAMNLNKVNKDIVKYITKIKIGTYKVEKVDIRKYVIDLFCNKKREVLITKIIDNKIGLDYLTRLANYNLNNFFSESDLIYNLQILEKTSELLYKVNGKILIQYLVNSIRLAKKKGVIKFMPKNTNVANRPVNYIKNTKPVEIRTTEINKKRKRSTKL